MGRLLCALSLIADGTGQGKGACQQEGAPQREIAVVAGFGADGTLDKDDLDGVAAGDILEGIGLHRADAPAVDLDVGNGVTRIGCDGKGLVAALADADIAGGRDGAAGSGSRLDGVAAMVAAAAGIDPIGLDGNVFARHEEVGNCAAGIGDHHIV